MRRLDFTPEGAYLLSLWIYKPHPKGIGVVGELSLIFYKKAVELGWIDPYKVSYDRKGVYFYNNKVERYLSKWKAEREHRIKYKNDYASAFFAGVYDSVGLEDKLKKLFLEDERILSRLGFKVMFDKYYWIKPFREFAIMIRPYSYRMKGQL